MFKFASRIFLTPPVILSIISGLIYSLVSLIKHWHFQTGLDLAIYNQMFWFYSQFKLPYVTLYPTFGRLVWADHLTPTLALLTPFYSLFPKAETLLVLQSFLFTIGAIPIYLITKEKTKDAFFSAVIALAYLLFFGSQFALTFDFHAATIGASLLPWIFYFLEKERWKIFAVLIILSLGIKEDMALIIFSLGIFMLFRARWRRIGVFTLLLAFSYLLLTVFFIFPSLSQAVKKEYLATDFPQSFGAFINFFLSPTKIKTTFLSFLSFGFLPFFSPATWIFPIIHFGYNFLGPAGRGDIYMHYRIILAPLLAYSSIYGALNFSRFVKKYLSPNLTFKICGSMLLVLVFILQYFLHLPLNSLGKRDFYQERGWMKDNEKLVDMVPAQVSISTQNHLSPYLSGREKLYYFPAQEDYILLDLRLGQPPVNWWASPPPEESKKIIGDWAEKGEYQILEKSGEAMLLKKSTK